MLHLRQVGCGTGGPEGIVVACIGPGIGERDQLAIANHFRSKGGDDPLFGHLQPPVHGSEPR